jgi:nitrite reductase/ring-hydroxylating ferredoxin subunit
MRIVSRLEQAKDLDPFVELGQRAARKLPPGMSGPLSDGDLSDGCITCPWHGSIFRLADGSVARGPATAPQPVFDTRTRDGILQVRLPDAG